MTSQSSSPTTSDYWKDSEQINGRLAMIGFFALVHNYVLTGWVIPGLF